jgi:hypothetical protein
MRTPEELERVAFKEPLTSEEDDALVSCFRRRADEDRVPKTKTSLLKQSAFFATRAFDKGARDPERLKEYVRLLTEVQRAAPSVSFRRKLAEMKSVLAGKGSHESILKKLARKGEAGPRDILATDEHLDSVEAALGVSLPESYRHYLKSYAHRQIGAYAPYSALELENAIQTARTQEVEPYLLPFLEDNADYFCFDMRSKVPEPPVVFWSHNGTSDETWPNFAAWVEECWLGELED